MSQEETDKIMQPIKKYFDFLFQRDARVISSSTGGSGSFLIVLETKDIRIHFSGDRGTITVQIGPLPSTLNSPNETCDLVIVIMFLTQKRVLINYLENRYDDEKQLERLAKAFRFYHDPILELFKAETFAKEKKALYQVGSEVQVLLTDPQQFAEMKNLSDQSGF
jgi:hypothetical protein